MEGDAHWVCLDGEWIKNLSAIPVQNRSFLYGDGFFETMRTSGVDVIFVETHFERMRKSMAMLDLPDISELQFERFCNNLATLIHKNKWYKGARVRLTVFRKGSGRYTPQDNETGFLLDGEPFCPDYFYPFVGTGKLVTVYSEIKKPLNKLSALKTTSSLFYVLAGNFAKKHNFDDCFILNEQDEIIETVNSNVFVLVGRKVIAPGPLNGALDGTMRKQVLAMLIEAGYEINEGGISDHDLEVADEVLLTNAVQGINWVKGYKERRYYYQVGMELAEKLNLKISNRDY